MTVDADVFRCSSGSLCSVNIVIVLSFPVALREN